MRLKPRHVGALLEACNNTRAIEIDCEQFLDAMAAYVEARAGGQALPEHLRDADAHVRLCASCSEECRALLELLQEP